MVEREARHVFWIRLASFRKCVKFSDHVFERSRGCEYIPKSSRNVADVLERVDRALWHEPKITGLHMMPNPINLDIELAFFKEKRLVLCMMDVPTRPLSGLHDVFEHRVSATGLRSGKQHLKGYHAGKIKSVSIG